MRNQTKLVNGRRVVAEICLYGNGPRGCGAGHIAALPNGQMVGTGEPVKGATFTQAIFSALNDLQDAGIQSGTVAIFDAGGERVAFGQIGRATFYYGSLHWDVAAGYTVSIAELLGAEEGR